MLLNDREIDKFYGTYERPVRWEPEKKTKYERRFMYMKKKDCFAYRIGGCSILTEMICRRGACSFYKTKEQADKDREKYGFKRDYQPKGDTQ